MKQIKTMIIADLDAARKEIASLSHKVETGTADRRAFSIDLAITDERIAKAIKTIKAS